MRPFHWAVDFRAPYCFGHTAYLYKNWRTCGDIDISKYPQKERIMVNQSHPTCTVCRWFWLRVGICIAMLYTPQRQNVLISPPLTLEDMEVVRQEISEKYFTQPPEISTPLHVFFGLPKEVGGSSGCQTLALAFQDSQKRNPTAAMEFLAWWLLEL